MKPYAVRRFIYGICVSLLFAACDIHAQNNLIDNLKDYIKFSAKRSPPAPPRESSLYVGAELNLDARLACSKFDPKLSVDYALTGLKETMSTIESIPKTVISSLPGVVFCRALPGVCELAQEYTARFENRFNLAVKSCEQMIADATQGRNPYQDIVDVTVENAWNQGQLANKTPNQVQKEMPAVKDQGITWLGGKKHGGRGQRQIRPVRHTIAAGWCIANGENRTDCETSTAVNEYTKTWPTAAELKEWITAVVGDIGFWIYQGAPTPQSYPGLGLTAKVSEREPLIKAKLEQLTQTPANKIYDIDADDLEFLSSGSQRMLPQILTALQVDLDKEWLLDRLANEISVAQTLDETLLARRLLLIGAKEPNLYAHKKFISGEVDQALERLESEIEQLLMEAEARGKVVSDLVIRILERAEQRQNARNNVSPDAPRARTQP